MKTKEIEKIMQELRLRLTLNVDAHKFNKDSIMEYDVLCDHDENFLCEHRLQWILDFVENKLKEIGGEG